MIDSIPLLPEFIEELCRFLRTPWQRAQHLGDGVSVGPNQFPNLFSILLTHANALNVPCPELFIRQDPTLNAFTFGTNDDACVVVHSALIDLLDESELSFILGHEMGHIKARHVTYGSVLKMITDGLIARVGSAIVAAPLEAWSRETELTADQVGALLVDEPEAAIRALMLLAVGSRKLLSMMHLGQYLEQEDDLADYSGTLNLYLGGNSHPYTVNRVTNLLRFLNSPATRLARATLKRTRLALKRRGQVLPTAQQPTGHKSITRPAFCPNCGFEISDRGACSCSICGFAFGRPRSD